MSTVRLTIASVVVVAIHFTQFCMSSAEGQTNTYPVMIQLDLDDETIQATPVLATNSEVIMLGRDGQMWDFDPRDASNFSQLPKPFQAMTQGEMRGALLSEFGNQFDVTGTGNYLVVHPKGTKDQWAGQFEKLYRSFQQYFAARGIYPERPQFPLVAIVFPDFKSYQKYAAQEGMRVSRGIVGYYSGKTNRVALYDVTFGTHNEALWEENINTVIHEATHQTAFNTGIHNRFAGGPKWLIEGLATMFEAPGVWDSRNYNHFRDRVNKTRMLEFLEYARTQRAPNSLAAFVTNDKAYLRRPSTAYGEGWALVFYLIETRPREFAAYVRKVADQPNGATYSDAERLKDFQDAFGQDLNQLEAHFLRYIDELPSKMK
ncbi:DUF1570 domain-containing protein [bacterium]|nr:DUF1570 domain-containing protein [bacterium]